MKLKEFNIDWRVVVVFALLIALFITIYIDGKA